MKVVDKKHLGIIGYGAMARFMAKHLRTHFVLHIYSPNSKPEHAAEHASLEEAASQPFVLLCTPVQVLEQVLLDCKNFFKPGALVLDVCSVKTIPLELLAKHLPKNVDYIGTHPVFGPDSGKDGIAELTVALCPGRASKARYKKLAEFLRTAYKLKVVECSAQEHDTEMAYALSLTHLISRSINVMDIPKLTLSTKSYDLMMAIKENLSGDSEELFVTIQNYNPYAKAVRQHFIAQIEKLEELLERREARD